MDREDDAKDADLGSGMVNDTHSLDEAVDGAEEEQFRDERDGEV